MNDKETRNYWQERALAVENTLRLLISLMHEQHGLNFAHVEHCLDARIKHINTQFEAGRRQWTDEEAARQQATGKLDL